MTRSGLPPEPGDFIAIRGTWTLKIVPRTARGRIAAVLWVLLLMLPYVPFILLAVWVDGTPRETWVLWALGPMLLLTALTSWAMIRWMLARATILSPEDFEALARSRRPGGGRTPRR